MGQIIVRKASGGQVPLNSKAKASIVTRAEHYKALLGEDVLRISVTSSRPLDIAVGDAVEAFGHTFTINSTPLARKSGEGNFSYDLIFEGAQYDLLSVKYLDADANDQIVDGGEFSLTADLAGFLDVLVYNTRRKFNDKWMVGTCPETGFRNLPFSSENCLAVLQRLCQEFEQEFDIELLAGHYVINIRKQGSVLPYTFEYGKGKGLYELTRKAVTDKNPVSVLFAFGGSRNIPSNYRGGSRRLKLPGNNLSKLENPDVVSAIGVHEGSVVFDDIYPKRTGTVTALGANHLSFTDSEMDFDLAAKNAGGETIYLFAGSSAKIHFNTGNLAGYEFEVTSYNHASKTFTISTFTDDRGQVFPDANSLALKISEGDKYVLLDIRMPQSYVDAAEAALQSKAEQFYEENKGFHTQYELDLDERFIKSVDGSDSLLNFFTPGDHIHIKDADLETDKTLRLQSFVRDLANPYKYKIVISDSTVQTRIERLIAESVENTRTIRQNGLADPARSRRNWRTTSELVAMLETLRAEVALIGTDEGQFVTDVFFRPNYSGNPNLFKTTAGQLIHAVYPVDNPGTWNMAAYEGTLTNAGAYYIYAKCSRTTSTGSIYPSLERIGVEDHAGFYHFPLGILSSVSDNARVFTSTYGYTLISGNNITTGVIQNEQSGITINLQTGEIKGAFKFTNGQLVEDVLAEKNGRYIGNTDPADAWGTNNEKRAHLNDQWIRFIDDTTVSFFYTEVTPNVFEWVPDQTQIDGGRITTGLIEAGRINVEGLFSKAIVANNLDVQTGRVGGFVIASQLIGRSGTGALGLDPDNKEVYIEGNGKKVISIRQGGITPLLNFPASQHAVTGSLKKYIETQKSRNDLLASPTVTVYVGYSSGQTLVKGTPLTESEKFSLGFAGKNTPYSANLPFNFDIIHSMAMEDGRYHKLLGKINAQVTAELWVGTTLIDTRGFLLSISLDSNETDPRIFPRIERTNITVNNAQKAYWKLTVQLTGDMRYQYYTHSTWFRSSSWTNMNSTPITYRVGVDGGLSFVSGIGITEIGSNGLQAYWNHDRYFRVDGEDIAAFIRSAGTWMHNGYEVATSANINQITANLANYVLISDLQSAYYNKTQSDQRYAKLAGDSTQDFTIKDLTIHGTVNRWLADTITVDDANLQLNRRQGGATVASGLIIFNRDTQQEVTKLQYGVNNLWAIDDRRIATISNSPTANQIVYWDSATASLLSRSSAFNSDALQGYAASAFPRKGENASVSGAWVFSQMINAPGFSHQTPQLAAATEANQILVVNNSSGSISPQPPGQSIAAINKAISFNWYNENWQMGGIRGWSTESIGLGIAKFGTDLCLRVNTDGVYFKNNLSTAGIFSSGFAGSGWRLDATDNHLTVDKLTVRRQMNVYELVANQIRATNGSLWVSDVVKISHVSAGDLWDLRFDNDNGRKGKVFVPGDIIKAQRFDGRNTKVTVLKVEDYEVNNPEYYFCSFLQGSAPEAGDEFVRIGNVSDSNRQGSIYITSSDDGAPYMDVLDGVNTASLAGKTRLRIGKLSGIPGQSGYGIWGSRDGVNEAFAISSNGYARIAGWNFDNTRLYSGSVLGANAPGLELNKDGYISLHRNNANRLVFTNWNDNDWGIGGYINDVPVFQLGSTNKIAGCNFNAGSIWSTGEKWKLNADGSGHLAGNKISWGANGNLTIQQSLIAQSLTGQLLQSTNWAGENSATGALFALNNGRLQFGNVIDINSATNEIIVRDIVNSRDGVRIGNFDLSSTAGGGSSIEGSILGNLSFPPNINDNCFGTSYINSSRTLTTTVSNLTTNLITGNSYNLSFSLRFSLSSYNLKNAYITQLKLEADSFFDDINFNATITITDGLNNVVHLQNEPMSGFYFPGDVLNIDAFVNKTFTALHTTLRVKIEITSNAKYVLYSSWTPGGFRVDEYNTKCNLLAKPSTILSLKSVSGVTEISTKGFLSLWGSTKYFQIKDVAGNNPFVTAKGYTLLESSDGNNKLEVNDSGVKVTGNFALGYFENSLVSGTSGTPTIVDTNMFSTIYASRSNAAGFIRLTGGQPGQFLIIVNTNNSFDLTVQNTVLGNLVLNGGMGMLLTYVPALLGPLRSAGWFRLAQFDNNW